ncbi:hypothetical protein AB6A40_003154 [Gnathostoma spinigerum]|uniref:Kelch domain-containing protein 3 n=1 Tax=Gnathostoma spinigerum TaxID=75299 RepID=A0ABD6E8P7_9BILA
MCYWRGLPSFHWGLCTSCSCHMSNRKTRRTLQMLWTVKVDGGPKRVNHAAVGIGDKIYSFGGYCSGEIYDGSQPIDVHVLDTVTYRWKKVEVQNDESEQAAAAANSILSQPSPFQRYGHTVVAYKGKAYLWGGRNDEFGASSKLHEFDPVSRTWSVVSINGPPPLARDGHSAVVIGDCMYMFGGFEEETQRFSCETYFFNFKTRRWSELRTHGAVPQWRDFHTACAIGEKMYVFGGRSDQLGQFHSSRDVYCDKLRVLDTKTGRWEEPPVSGVRPCGRRSHSSWAYNGRIYIFGGYLGTENKHFGDLWEYDPAKATWKLCWPEGERPCPRRRQCTVLIGSRLFLFGGTRPCKDVKHDPFHSGLADLSDLYVLDYAPSLKDLAAISIINSDLFMTKDCPLPVELQWDLLMMIKPNQITVPRHDG